MNLKRNKREIIEIGKKLWLQGLVAANDGNISVRVRNDKFLTTATGVSKGELNYKNILLIDGQGHVLEKTNIKPSTELKMHLAIYEKRPDVQAVVHAHPPYATAFSITGEDLSEPFLSEMILLLGKVPIAPYATPSTEEVPQSILPYLEENNALLLQNHGALTFGASLQQTYYAMESLEHIAKIIFLSKTLGHPRPVPEYKIADLLKIKKEKF